MSSKDSWKVKKLSTAIGAEITGLSLADLNNQEIKEIENLLVENMVLFFPGQSPSIAEHVALVENFGNLE